MAPPPSPPATTANRRCFASATPPCLKGWSNSFWSERGEKKAFSLEPDAAFGVPSPDLIQYFSRREFIDAGEPEIGAIMLFTAMDGSEMPGVIREVNGDSITVDFNHPLAGRTVHFDIEVLEIDPALEE
jgi:FKBP-type peptidyl-prolyl cis-trans isomerase SlpA